MSLLKPSADWCLQRKEPQRPPGSLERLCRASASPGEGAGRPGPLCGHTSAPAWKGDW